MKVTKHKLASLHLDAGDYENPRETTSKQGISELAADIEAFGLTYPLHVWKTKVNGKERYAILDGSRRYRAIKMLLEAKGGAAFKDGIPCLVDAISKTPQQALARAIADNEHTKAHTSYEIAKAMARMEDEFEMPRQDIAEAISKSKTWVSRMLNAFDAAIPEVRKAWAKQKLTNENVQEITKLTPKKQKEKLERIYKAQDDKKKGQRETSAAARKELSPQGSQYKAPPKKQIHMYIHALDENLKTKSKKRKKVDVFSQTLGLKQGLELASGIIGPAEVSQEVLDMLTQGGHRTDRKKKRAAN